MSTFGDVPATYPPGFVFDVGTWFTPDKHFTPIRFLHFEQRRIVIDVAGPSSAIDGIFEHNDSHSFTFALRAGTKPEEQIFCSGAPLDSETHLEYLSEPEAILCPRD